MPRRPAAARLAAALRVAGDLLRRGVTHRVTRWAAVVAVAVGALGAAAGGVVWWRICAPADACPDVAVLDDYRPRQTSKVYAADGRFVTEIGYERRTLVPLAEIPAVVRDAFITVEDKRFWRHRGIDWWRLMGAAVANVRAGGFAQGFSTITMQLARNVFPERLTREKSLVRKIKEARVARAIERRFAKERILELYLNQINLGSGAYGVESAAQRYFGKPVAALEVAEAAMLAAIPKAPGRYNPRRYPDRAVQRRNTVLELMRRDGLLSDDAASLAKAAPLQLTRRTVSGEIAPYFVEWVRQLLQERFGDELYERGLNVYTTLDLEMQSAAERALEQQLRAIEGGAAGRYPHDTYEQLLARGGSADVAAAESPYLQGAFVALDPRTGAVRALVGGRDFEDSKFDRVRQALRQPGSTFKPIVYATAVQAGRPLSSILDDSELALEQIDGTTWTPQNYELTFDGPVPMREALFRSRNLPAIRLGMDLGEASVIEMARRFGLSTPIPPYPSIHIGSADVVPLEMVNAYAVFATLGERATPSPVVRVEAADGRVLWSPQVERVRVLAPEAAWLMTDMLKDVVRRGSANGAVWRAGFQVPSGGKTGTTNEYADVWYIGFTADLVAGVWVGFDRPRRIMNNAQGGRLAAPAWTAFATEVYQRRPTPPDWPRPSVLVSAEVDTPTGMLRGDCPAERAYVEWFIPGTEPIARCDPSLPVPARRGDGAP
jgi:penicillin-binding protein 1A